MRRPPLPLILVASGKGGVGKSSIAVALARALVRGGDRCGLVDADLHGPDVPRMLGLRRGKPARSVTLARWDSGGGSGSDRLEAAEVDGMQVASVGFLMGDAQGLAVDATFGAMLLSRLVEQTAWADDLRALVVDLPPGAGGAQHALLGRAGPVAAVLVVTPAEVSHLDTGRALAVLREAGTDILGGVENMAYLDCPGCGARTGLHPPTPQERTIWAHGVDRLASLPFRQDGTVDAAALAPVVAAVTGYLAAN